jgi:hypothetical protein
MLAVYWLILAAASKRRPPAAGGRIKIAGGRHKREQWHAVT